MNVKEEINSKKPSEGKKKNYATAIIFYIFFFSYALIKITASV
jgi:hypothetical protein